MACYVPTISYPESSGSSDRWLKSVRTLPGYEIDVPIGCFRLARYCGKMNSRHFFRTLDFAFLIPRQKPKIISVYYLYKREKLSLLSRNIIKEDTF